MLSIRTWTALLLVAATPVTATVAHADPSDTEPDVNADDLGLASGHDVLDPATPSGVEARLASQPTRWRWDAGFRLDNGATSLNARADLLGGAAFETGLRYGRVALLASYALYGVGDGGCAAGDTICMHGASEPSGEAIEQRVGLDLRAAVYRGSMMVKGKHEHVAHRTPAELYVEAGAGREFITWTTAGVPDLTRDDLDVGVGLALPAMGETSHAIGRIGLRAMIAGGAPTVMLSIGADFGN